MRLMLITAVNRWNKQARIVLLRLSIITLHRILNSQAHQTVRIRFGCNVNFKKVCPLIETYLAVSVGVHATDYPPQVLLCEHESVSFEVLLDACGIYHIRIHYRHHIESLPHTKLKL